MPKMSEKLSEKFRNLHEQTLISIPEEGVLSYGAVWANALRIAQDWGQKGLSSGDRVAFVTPNDPAILVSYIACAIGGFVLCPVPSTLNRPFIDRTLEVLKPKLLVEDPPKIDYQVAPPSPNEIEFTIGDHDPFSIVFSSGTTGEPRGICHSFSTLISSAVAW